MTALTVVQFVSVSLLNFILFFSEQIFDSILFVSGSLQVMMQFNVTYFSVLLLHGFFFFLKYPVFQVGMLPLMLSCTLIGQHVVRVITAFN